MVVETLQKILAIGSVAMPHSHRKQLNQFQRFSTRTKLILVLMLFVWTGRMLIGIQQPIPTAFTISDTTQSKEIMHVMDQAYELFSTHLYDLDVTQFAEVLVNSQDFKLDDRQKAYVSQILGEKAVVNAGYLTAIQAKHTHLQHGLQLLTHAQNRAKSENRQLTVSEMEEIKAQNYGAYPPSFDSTDQTQHKPTLQYTFIKIEGDHATVRYDSGPALQEATLIRLGNRWFIANNVVLNAHF